MICEDKTTYTDEEARDVENEWLEMCKKIWMENRKLTPKGEDAVYNCKKCKSCERLFLPAIKKVQIYCHKECLKNTFRKK